MKQQLQVRIHPDGKIDAKTLGIKGSKCADYIEIFERLLDARTVESSYTEEYYQTATQNLTQTNMQKVQRGG